MKREYYSDSLDNFRRTSSNEIIGIIASNNEFSTEPTQMDSWSEEIEILKETLKLFSGTIYFEYSIPRMGKRIDTVVIIGSVIFVLEFKMGEKEYLTSAIDQVFDYALDLKNFHEPSHNQFIAPILIASKAKLSAAIIEVTPQNDKLLFPIKCNLEMLGDVINSVLHSTSGDIVDPKHWGSGRYCPTPTIIEAAMSLYKNHSVEDISRKDASDKNLTLTSQAISDVINFSKSNLQKSICFVTGVPGSGKTLVGLNIATKHVNSKSGLHSVYLSGNAPLVSILREALARDKVKSEKMQNRRITKKVALSEVSMFIQNVHNYRDAYLIDKTPPSDHVAIFDEAQRAWNVQQTRNFMQRKKKISNFNQSEPEYLISCLDRHRDWAVIVCLVGGGQEINTGEAGISEWIESLNRSFPNWKIYLSPHLDDSEYGAGKIMSEIKSQSQIVPNSDLHLSVSMRSFRAENVSLLVKQLLDLENIEASKTFTNLKNKYPIVITRNLLKAKQWLKRQSRGTERYGIVVSSQAERLKPHAIDVKSPMKPVNWFLNEKDDVRSSYYLEDVATEFAVQGLELDWACITWDADFRYGKNGWINKSFRGNRWNNIKSEERKNYQKNAYRVLLTRARQGMVIVVPEGDNEDPTRKAEYYDPTFEYLKKIGFTVL